MPHDIVGRRLGYSRHGVSDQRYSFCQKSVWTMAVKASRIILKISFSCGVLNFLNCKVNKLGINGLVVC